MAVRNWSSRFRWTTVLAPVVLMVAVTRPLLDMAPCPFGILALGLSLWSVWTGFVFRRLGWWAIQLAAVMLALAVGEAWLTYKHSGSQLSYDDLDVPGRPRKVPSELLGMAPISNQRIHHVLRIGDRTFVDAVYTINELGLRVVPGSEGGPGDETIVFMGCSFTYGIGVQDHETLPAQVAACCPRKNLLNFAFGGYGPQQMLANLESGRVARICPTPPRKVIFQMIPDHVRRVRGWVHFAANFPRYVRHEGGVRREGNLNDSWWSRMVMPHVWKSTIFERVVAPRMAGTTDVELAAAIVRQSAEEVSRQFPGCEFHVLFWNHPDKRLTLPLRRRLEEAGIHLHSLEQQIPELLNVGKKYRIPHDGHPTAETNRLMADYVCREILGEP
jgi:hypothetical protein